MGHSSVATSNRATDEPSRESRDILSSRLMTVVIYWLPILALVVSSAVNIGAGWRTAIWVAALSIMGTGCLVNAFRCRRVHCYLTGPFFLALAIITLLYGLGVVPLGPHGWSTISLALLVGGLLLYYVPEALLGRYRRDRQQRLGDSNDVNN